MLLAFRKSLTRSTSFHGPLTVAAIFWLAGCVVTAEATGRGSAPAPSPTDIPVSANLLTVLESRADLLAEQALLIETHDQREIAPVRAILAASPFASKSNEVLRRQIAIVIDREARARGLNAELLASVLIVENPWLDLDRRSSVGAVGLMQIMPFHAGQWECVSSDLEDLAVNICHGAGVFARDLRRSRGDVDRALLRYNGCVRGKNTPDCRSYPTKVYAQAGKAQLLDR